MLGKSELNRRCGAPVTEEKAFPDSFLIVWIPVKAPKSWTPWSKRLTETPKPTYEDVKPLIHGPHEVAKPNTFSL